EAGDIRGIARLHADHDDAGGIVELVFARVGAGNLAHAQAPALEGPLLAYAALELFSHDGIVLRLRAALHGELERGADGAARDLVLDPGQLLGKAAVDRAAVDREHDVAPAESGLGGG